MITAKGAGVLAAALAIYILARLSQVGWLYLVDAVFWGALALSLVMPWLGVAFINAHRRISHGDRSDADGRLSEGDQVHITISLRNRLFYPRFFHSIRFASDLAGPDAAEQKFFVAQLPGSKTLQLDTMLEAYQRGHHHLAPVMLESSAPFGLFRRRRALSGRHPMLVLPKVHPLRRLALVDGQDSQSVNTHVSRTGLDLAGSRPFVPGDSRRMVHWRNTARAGRMMVKETEDETNQTLQIIFESGDVWGTGRDTNFEYAIKLAASVADYALRHGVPVRVWGSHLHGTNVAAAESNGNPRGVTLNWQNFLESLAVAGPTGRAVMDEGLSSLQAGANLFVVAAANYGPAQANLSHALARTGEAVVVRLEGFGEPSSDGEADKPREWAGASVLTCRPGGLAQTFSEIESLGRWKRAEASAEASPEANGSIPIGDDSP